jgi:hypothetical protein
VEAKCGLPLVSNVSVFKEVVDYPPFECVFEVVDHPFFVEVLIYIFFGHNHFKKRNNFVHGRSSCGP